MSRFGGLSEERPSVFKTRSKLGTHLSTQCSGDEGRVDLAQPVNRTPDLWCGSTIYYHSILFDCNRTYYGLTDLKYPLRLSERRSPTCTLTFIAAGGRYGDRIEITFLSFQIGTFDLDRYMI
ncbi:uncharacterized protein TNCV_2340861 [Trichonephila clavipes]|nr:uncharacterized protein TNCV_2340861 [Trichonephila clavipes]